MVLNNQQAMRYNNVAITLHWLLAILLVAQFFTGWEFSDMEKGPARDFWFAWHRTLGFTVLFLSLVRLAWRFISQDHPHFVLCAAYCLTTHRVGLRFKW